MLSWLLEENIVSFVTIVAERVGYSADEWDTDAVKFGLDGTSESGGRWYEYPLTGRSTLVLSYARGRNGTVLVRGEVPGPLEAIVIAVLCILQVHCAEGVTEGVEALIMRAFGTNTRPEWLLRRTMQEYQSGPYEYDRILKALSGKRWQDLVRGTNRPPFNDDLYFLSEVSLQYFYPAYLVAALKDWDASWVEQIDRMEYEGWVSMPASATPLQRELQLFVLRVLGARPDAPAAF